MFYYQILPYFVLVASTLGSTTWYYDLVRAEHSLTDTLQANTAQKVEKEFPTNTPDRIDYREKGLVTPVRKEHANYSWYVSAVETLEGLYAARKNKLVQLPIEPVINHTHIKSRLPVAVLADIQGMDNLFPVQLRVTQAYTIIVFDLETMKYVLGQNGAPLAIMVYMSPEMKRYNGSEVLTPTDCKGQKPDYAASLVGYDTDSKSGKTYWMLKTSLGTEYGDKGYLNLDIQSQCTILKYGGATADVVIYA